MSKKICLILFLAICVEWQQVSAQKLLKKAEIQVENGEYIKAAENYKNYLKENPKDYKTMSLLAESLANAGELTEAEKWYQSIPSNEGIDPEIYRKHGDLLKKMSQYDDAFKKYEVYRSFRPFVAEHCIKSCEFAAKSMSQSQKYEIFVLPACSSSSDFGLTFYKNMPVFSSFRDDILMSETERELNTKSNAQKTLMYHTNTNRLVFVKGIYGQINHIGPVSFSTNGMKCAIIESKAEDTYNFVQKSKMSSLHLADVNARGEITSFRPFPFNEVGSSINAAHLAFDGTALYFSSDRSGGFGGYDIYVSYFNNNNWSIPQNLGNTINTQGDEITPYLVNNTLYFASDFHIGLGGFDILKSEVINGVWSPPANPGNGVNSPSDDYFPALNNLGELYVTSNRLGGRGKNDIYKIHPLQNTANTDDEYSYIPKAVSLDELAMETQKNTINTESAKVVSLKEESVVTFALPDFDVKKVGTNTIAEFSIADAHRIALDNLIPNTEVFFIQLASMSSIKPNFEKFKPLLRYGNIYKMLNNKSIKIRLGYFTERREAEEILTKVRTSGYKDAFIAYEMLNTAQMELILSSADDLNFSDKGNFNTKNPDVEKSYKTGNKYKVRLASYEDPIWFDVNKVKDLGRIEQWTKGGWTIFILAGYNSLEEAKSAQIQASNRGYKTAEVVIDNGGILERLKQN